MAYRYTPKLISPLKEDGSVMESFGENKHFDGKNWGTHLGIDVRVPAGTQIFSAGRGVVVYSKLHPGEFSPEGKVLKRNWGGITIVAHKNPKNKKIFYSLYGHLGKRYVKKGDSVEIGELIGEVGKAMSESNGIWETEHIHFAIYRGEFHERVLPGYLNEKNKKEDFADWLNPINFMKNYNRRYV